ncbi:MAG: hypothetical protein CMM52_00210 [Rhodospirillaceae bacterium]|nr:hypothetical protein [Rhodospirillaceae bacterium]|tara:strand:- start:14010 stop:14192 length:183 start_codon:yes stop_codon:yes gene_type:complete
MSPLATKIKTSLESEAQQFHDVVDEHMDVPWQEFLRAWGELRAIDILQRDDEGAYFIEVS